MKIDKQKIIIDFMKSYFFSNLRPPTIREIQKYMGFKSPRAATFHLEKIIKKFNIESDERTSNRKVLRYFLLTKKGEL